MRDIRTSLICKLLHSKTEQIFRVVGDVPYPNICYKCEPDSYMEAIRRLTLLQEKGRE